MSRGVKYRVDEGAMFSTGSFVFYIKARIVVHYCVLYYMYVCILALVDINVA
jgi:hypothetical protein